MKPQNQVHEEGSPYNLFLLDTTSSNVLMRSDLKAIVSMTIERIIDLQMEEALDVQTAHFTFQENKAQ